MNLQPDVPDPDPGTAVQNSSMSPTQTRQTMHAWGRRGYSVNRSILVQRPDRDKDRPSTVGRLTRERHHRALVLYLLLLAWWPWLHDRKTPLDSEVWIRALTAEGPGAANALTWSPSTLSRTWGDLRRYGLVRTEREGRLIRVTPRREDGLEDYQFPQGERDLFNRYFTLPNEFWTKQYFATLSPAALAVLLIVLKETIKKPDVELPRVRMTEWYGISGKTVTKGIQELDSLGLLRTRIDRVDDAATKYGVTDHYYYGLEEPFSTEERVKRRKVAKRKRSAAERKKAKSASAKET